MKDILRHVLTEDFFVIFTVVIVIVSYLKKMALYKFLFVHSVSHFLGFIFFYTSWRMVFSDS